MSKITQQLETLLKQSSKKNNSFKPVFYRLTNSEDRVAFTELLYTSRLEVFDNIRGQIDELIKCNAPSKKFSADDLLEESKKLIGDLSFYEYGVWVHYPWSNRLVHILDKKEFIDLRTSRNQNKITIEERDVLLQKKIGIIGLSVGQSVAVTLAMERGCGELRLADFDVLELTNLNRIRTGLNNLGLAKVYAVAREIAEIDPYLEVKCFPEGITEANMDQFFCAEGKLDLLIEESDGFDIKILSRHKARELKIPVLMEASDRCMVDVERFDLEPNRSILHGLVDHLDLATLKGLKTTEQKIPYMLEILGIDSASPRLKASMLEIEQSINTWPQLASAVTMGGGITADVSRRILLNQFSDSGRYNVDIEELIADKREAEPIIEEQANSRINRETLWQLAKTNPSDACAADLEQIVIAAGQAPSLGNMQPWNWVSCDSSLFLLFNAEYRLSSLDTDYLASYTSLGASLENAKLKAASLGYTSQVSLFPVVDNPELVASICFTSSPVKELINEGLEAIIPIQQTNRKKATSTPVELDTLNKIKAMIGNCDGLKLDFITNPKQIDQIAEIYGKSERLQQLDPAIHKDYFGKGLFFDAAKTPRRGVSVEALEMPTIMKYATRMVSDKRVAQYLMAWNKGQILESWHKGIVASSPVIGVLSVNDQSKESLIHAGSEAQRIWLKANLMGLAFQPLNLPIYINKRFNASRQSNKQWHANIFSETESISRQLNTIFTEFETKEPVFLFRVFYAEKTGHKSERIELIDMYQNLTS